jgi:molybdopterin-binding protein
MTGTALRAGAVMLPGDPDPPLPRKPDHRRYQVIWEEDLNDRADLARYARTAVTTYRVGQVAELLGVSADTVRRWADDGRIGASRRDHGERVIEGAELARFLTAAAKPTEESPVVESARNRFPGVVTKVEKDSLVAVVHIQAGPHRVVSLMTREGADELGIEPGDLAVAVVKATNVVVEVPRPE